MFIRKKTEKRNTKEISIIKYINQELNDYEEPIFIKFGEPKSSFSFYNKSYQYLPSYFNQNFSFAVEQINRALDLLKKSLLNIKNKFNDNVIQSQIVIDKINELLQLEKSFQIKMQEEQKLHQSKDGDGILFTTISLFQELSRDFMLFVIKIKDELVTYIKNNFVDFDIANSIYESIKEQDVKLPRELRNYKYNLNGYSIIFYLENFIRMLVIIVLKAKTSKQILPSDLYEKVKNEKSTENANKWCDERFGGDLFYVNLIDLVKIIEHNKAEFTKNSIKIEKIKSEIEKINTIRNKLAHNNIISKEDLNILQINSKIVYKYCKKYFETIENYKFNKNKKIKLKKNNDL